MTASLTDAQLDSMTEQEKWDYWCEDIGESNDPDHEICITLKSGETIYHDCPANWWEDDSWKEDLINALGYEMAEVQSTSIQG